MNARTLNWDLYRAALLSKATECKEKLQDAQNYISIDLTAGTRERGLYASNRAIAVERMESFHRLLRQVESALSRMSRGRYGVCLKCEKDIRPKRLDAVPWAIFCVDCQQGVDLLHQGARARREEIRRAA